jgi:hypothetical protein
VALNLEDQIRELCRVIAIERDPAELHVLLQRLEFALREFNLGVQNQAVHKLGYALSPEPSPGR